jgi:cyclic pyranopterin phosphate synthase
MPEEDYEFAPSSKLMQADEIRKLAGIFVSLGVKKIRLTGGEPLVRKDAADIILSLAELPVHLTLTTNGSRLDHYFPVLQKAGIQSVNISLDTLDPGKFIHMTKRNQFKAVMDNIQQMIDNQFHVKINVVVTRGLNEMEIPDFVEWTKHDPVHVRFIEFMPFDGNRWSSDRVFSWSEMLDMIAGKYPFSRLVDENNGTAKKYQITDHKGTFSVISTMSAPFCGTCNRMRLTADGKIKNCLFSREETDLLSAIRKGENVIPLIKSCVIRKKYALGGQFTPNFRELVPEDIRNRSMISIGG